MRNQCTRTAENGKYRLPYSMKASLSNNASKIRDINLPETTDIRSKWREISGCKRGEEKKWKGKRRNSFSSLLPEKSREETDEFSTVHRFLAWQLVLAPKHEMYSPREETWADKTGSGATGCDRGNQWTHYIAVTEAEEGKLFDITYIRLLLPPPILNTRYYIACLAIDRSIEKTATVTPPPSSLPPWKAGIKYSITIKRRSSINPLSTRVWKKCFHLDGSGHGRSRRVYETRPPPPI